jgi:hypothetical protein
MKNTYKRKLLKRKKGRKTTMSNNKKYQEIYINEYTSKHEEIRNVVIACRGRDKDDNIIQFQEAVRGAMFLAHYLPTKGVFSTGWNIKIKKSEVEARSHLALTFQEGTYENWSPFKITWKFPFTLYEFTVNAKTRKEGMLEFIDDELRAHFSKLLGSKIENDLFVEFVKL